MLTDFTILANMLCVMEFNVHLRMNVKIILSDPTKQIKKKQKGRKYAFFENFRPQFKLNFETGNLEDL